VETFSAGQVLSTGLRMFARAVFRFFPVLLIVYAPVLILHVQAMVAAPGLDQATAAARASNWDWLVIVLEVPATAIVTYWIVRDLRGKQPRVVESVLAGLRRASPALGVMFLVYLVVFALAFAVGIPVGAAAALDRTGVISAVFSIAMLVMVVAVYSRWFVAIPAVVIERPGVAGALTRSSDLTEGRRWRICALIVFTNVLFVGLLMAVNGAAFTRDGAWYYDAALRPWLATLNIAVFILFAVLRASLSAAAYYHIRTETEAQSPDQLAKIFE
jgi:hypothetical protein